MAKTPEGAVKKKVKEMLDQYQAYHNWPVPAGYGEPMLDCVGCHDARFFAIETKAPGERLTPRQGYVKEKMEVAKGKVFVIGEHELEKGWYSGMDELRAWLQHQ